MMPLPGLTAVNAAFAREARTVDPAAPVQSEIWPTASSMIDHLGNIQAWATEIVRTGQAADRTAFRRPPERDQAEWFTEVSGTLVDTLAEADEHRECWTILDAPPVTSFWGQRMTSEATKHLWDLRTAVEATPAMPDELGPNQQAAVIDEFVNVFVPAARARGIAPLPGAVGLVANDIGRQWHFSRDWVVSDEVAGLDSHAEQLHASVGDLVLFVWQRANPWALPARFRMDADEGALRAFAGTPVHL